MFFPKHDTIYTNLMDCAISYTFQILYYSYDATIYGWKSIFLFPWWIIWLYGQLATIEICYASFFFISSKHQMRETDKIVLNGLRIIRVQFFFLTYKLNHIIFIFSDTTDVVSGHSSPVVLWFGWTLSPPPHFIYTYNIPLPP